MTPAISQASRHADYDAVIVGSGINSLVAAATLARGGWRVCVLERNDELGGAIRTAEITVPGFTHDVFSAWHPLFVLSGAYAKLGEELRSRGLEYLTADLVTATLFPDVKPRSSAGLQKPTPLSSTATPRSMVGRSSANSMTSSATPTSVSPCSRPNWRGAPEAHSRCGRCVASGAVA